MNEAKILKLRTFTSCNTARRFLYSTGGNPSFRKSSGCNAVQHRNNFMIAWELKINANCNLLIISKGRHRFFTACSKKDCKLQSYWLVCIHFQFSCYPEVVHYAILHCILKISWQISSCIICVTPCNILRCECAKFQIFCFNHNGRIQKNMYQSENRKLRHRVSGRMPFYCIVR